MHVMKTFNNAEKFLVMDVVINFSWTEFVGVKGDRMQVTILIRLLKATIQCKVRHVGGQGAGFLRIKVLENGSSSETVLQFIECRTSGI
jgi:hypothetical protein